jgi:hypothetical protein
LPYLDGGIRIIPFSIYTGVHWRNLLLSSCVLRERAERPEEARVISKASLSVIYWMSTEETI